MAGLVDTRQPLTARDYWGLGIAGAGAVLPSLFGGGGDDAINKALGNLGKNATEATDLSKSLGTQGSELLGPASEFLRKILSGDRQEMLEATAPERRRVIDQYAAAKKAIAEFAPRSGGQAASLNDLQAKEAGDLATIGSTARMNATGTALSAGTNLTNLGLNASGQAANDYAAIIQGLTQQQANKSQSMGQLGQALGTIAGLILL